MTKARDLANIISGGFTADDIPNLDTAKLTTGTIASARINNDSLSAITALPSGVGGIALQAVQTTGFTAVAGKGYPCNTTSAAFTVTLPATPSAGDEVIILDYAGTFDTFALTIDPNGGKIEGATDNLKLTGEREGVRLVYIDSTQGWLAYSGINEGTDALSPTTYSVDFLVIAGGGGGAWGGGGAGGYRNSYLTETSGGGGSSEAILTFNPGTVYTVTVGGGGAGAGSVTGGSNGSNGANSSISGTGITTITSSGGGGGGEDGNIGSAGGSGGGGSNSAAGGAGTANQGFAGGAGVSTSAGAGGGGASAVGSNTSGNPGSGGNGGAGLSSSITGSSIGRAGGGGGGGRNDSGGSNAGGTASNGGGAGGAANANGTAGTVNTGGGGGGGGYNGSSFTGGAGGKGVVILRIPTADYSGTTTGSPTVTTDGSDKVIVFNDSGTITG